MKKWNLIVDVAKCTNCNCCTLANQDERHWQQPERFDIHRTGAHAAFGLGAHHCAGASLARHEVRLQRPDGETRWISAK